MLDLISMLVDDLLLATDLQFEKVYRLSTHLERVCAVCKLVIPSFEASWKPDDCDHVICIACFWQYAPETEATRLPRCAVASCESLCKSETHQGMNVSHSTLTSIEDMDSRKGKKPLDSMLQESQCSRDANAMARSKFYCTICMETVHVSELFSISGCTHLFCVSCMSQYITAKIKDNVLSIGCPEPGCKDGALDLEVCRDVIPPQLLQKWDAALCGLALGAFKFHCPFKDCSALLVNDRGYGEAVIRKAECPHCSRTFCVQCKVAWHDGVTCEYFQGLRNEGEQGDLLLRKVSQESKWQRCTRCAATCLCKSETYQGINVGHSTLISVEDMDSHKGREPLDIMPQKVGHGLGHGANAMATSVFYCAICMETLHVREIFPISRCTHLFCVSCMSQYITVKVEDNVLSIGCPEPGCKDGTLDPELCRDVIPMQLFQKWGDALCDSALGAFKFYCPFEDCSALLVDERGHDETALTKADCPRCSRMFYVQCKVAWHDDVTCERKATLDDMLQDRGQCSGSANAMASSKFYCTICMETVHVREFFPISGCTHLFCASCVSQYIIAKVEDNVLSIGCPEPGCKDGALDPELCRDVIPLQLFQKWGAALCDSALGASKFYCPFKDCSVLLVDERGHDEAVITRAECPHCCRMFCAQCKVAWHDGVTCTEFQRLGKDERAKDDLLLRKVAQERKWQRCPKCKMYVERAEGCVYIVCRCGHRFCYLCTSPMSKGNHHCSRCNRTW